MALLIGAKYGRLTVLGVFRLQGSKRSRLMATCLCDCGVSLTIRAGAVGSNSKSCGCLSRDLTVERNKERCTHGKHGSKAYHIWSSMVARCCCPTNERYSDYGGRGITVCDEWKTFQGFYSDMGDPPTGMTLDRKENNLGYCKSNCRWATLLEQANNKRSNRLLTLDGKTQTVAEWSRSLGIKSATIRQRIDAYGWSVAAALTKKGV